MNQQHINFGGIACLLAGVYSMYYMLLHDNTLPWSIRGVETILSHSMQHWHVIVVGLMPVYVAFALFGAAISSLFIGSRLQHLVLDFLHQDEKIS